jgi:hypothetical protein
MDLIFFLEISSCIERAQRKSAFFGANPSYPQNGELHLNCWGGGGGRTEKDRRRKWIMLYDEMNTTPLFSRIKSALTTNRDSMIMTLQFQQIKSCLRFKALMMMMIMMKLMRMRSMIEGSLCANG